MLSVSLLGSSAYSLPTEPNRDRPKLPYGYITLRQDDVDAYDSKAEPVENARAALLAMNKAGWELIRKYFPLLGTPSGAAEKRSLSTDQESAPGEKLESGVQLLVDNRFVAGYANDDASLSPVPLLCIVRSLPESELSGRLKSLHDELATAMVLENYWVWKLDDLRKLVNDTTTRTKTPKGVKYRIPKSNLSFAQALRLYAVTLALIRAETKWADKADSPLPDMADFTNRLRQQLPRQVPDGGVAAFFLYQPYILNQPLSKEEYEERADVVVLHRHGMTVEVEQYPVYLTENQQEWSPAWIEPADLANDSTLLARKLEHDWTRLDGPFLWFRDDLLSGETSYRATVQLSASEITIEAERMIGFRGAVKRAQRPRDYDPTLITAFNPAVDEPAAAVEALIVDIPSLTQQTNSLKRIGPHFSNSFVAWCNYGLSKSGLAADGKTWITVPDFDSYHRLRFRGRLR